MKLEYKILKEKVRDYNKKDAQFYSSIFAKMSKVEQTKATTSWQHQIIAAIKIFGVFLMIVFLIRLLFGMRMQNTTTKHDAMLMAIDNKA